MGGKPGALKVYCSRCKEQLDPYFVLEQFANRGRRKDHELEIAGEFLGLLMKAASLGIRVHITKSGARFIMPNKITRSSQLTKLNMSNTIWTMSELIRATEKGLVAVDQIQEADNEPGETA